MDNKKRKIIAIDKDVHAELKKLAANAEMSIKQYLRNIIEEKSNSNHQLEKDQR